MDEVIFLVQSAFHLRLGGRTAQPVNGIRHSEGMIYEFFKIRALSENATRHFEGTQRTGV